MIYHIGLVGCGSIAGSWIKAVAQHPDCQIRLTYDPVREAAVKRASEADAEVADRFEQILDNADINLVILGTPTPTHPDLAIQAATAGKHILCEKPMALNLTLCQRMIDTCAKAGVKLAVGHSLRFWSAFLACRQLIAEGAIGTPCSGSIDRLGIAKPIPVLPPGEQKDSTHWRADPRCSGGLVLEGLIHELDFTRAVYGEVASVCCETAGGQEYQGLQSPPLVEALVRFESGALVTIRTGSTVALPARQYWLGGTEGGLHFTHWSGPVQHYRHDFEEPRSIACADTYAYYLELGDLIRAIEQDQEPENSGLNGKKNVALGLGMYRASETGRRISYQNGLPLDMAEDYQYQGWR